MGHTDIITDDLSALKALTGWVERQPIGIGMDGKDLVAARAQRSAFSLPVSLTISPLAYTLAPRSLDRGEIRFHDVVRFPGTDEVPLVEQIENELKRKHEK